MLRAGSTAPLMILAMLLTSVALPQDAGGSSPPRRPAPPESSRPDLGPGGSAEGREAPPGGPGLAGQDSSRATEAPRREGAGALRADGPPRPGLEPRRPRQERDDGAPGELSDAEEELLFSRVEEELARLSARIEGLRGRLRELRMGSPRQPSSRLPPLVEGPERERGRRGPEEMPGFPPAPGRRPGGLEAPREPGSPRGPGGPRALEPGEESAHAALLAQQDELVARLRTGEAPAGSRDELRSVLLSILDLRERARVRQLEELRAQLRALEQETALRREPAVRGALVESRIEELLEAAPRATPRGPSQRP